MPVYQTPGVYVEEIPSDQPIAPVGTSTAGFIGQAADDTLMPYKARIADGRETIAPLGEPQLITSWTNFKGKFGDFKEFEDDQLIKRVANTGNTVLAHAVKGFFENGGSRCYVARVASVTDADEVDRVLAKFLAIDEIAIVAAPGVVDATVQGKLVDHCVNAGDRFAILDGAESPENYEYDTIKGTIGNSDYAAMYFPWLETYDPVNSTPAERKTSFIPPSGHVAGVYARVDTQRGVHKAPANESIRSISGLKYRLTKADQAGLNPDGINIIREFNGNFKVWGARTLGGDKNGEFKYVNVRRLFLFLRESIDEGFQWAVFEPNAQPLWAKVTRTLTAFLTNVWRDGALFGTSPEQAFYVKCDEELNPKEVRDLGIMLCEIGVAVVTPAEFVVFRISQRTQAGGS